MSTSLQLAASAGEVRAIIELVNSSFHDMPDKLFQLNENLGKGMQKARFTQWHDEEVERVYSQAYALFEAQRYQEALPMALYLTIHRPLDQRFMFMAGLILQLLGDPLLAAGFFATLLVIDPNFMPAAFRLAECYATLGEQQEAFEIFELAIDMGRGDLGDADEFYALQRLIAEKLSTMH